MMIQHKNKRSGFSVVEMMAAMLALAILVLTVGLVLISAWTGWTRGKASVQMQRDATVAMRLIAKEVRQTPIENITTGTSLVCGTNSFTKVGSNLVYKEIDLVDGVVTSFRTRKDVSEGTVQVSLNLDTGSDQSSIIATFYSRN